MSKFCGIFHFDARPASPEDEGRVGTALHRPGWLPPQTCRQPGLLLGWVAASPTPRGTGLFQASGRDVCLWDGRIDNRKDLLAQTGLRPDCTDAALALSCYRKNGVVGLRGLVGDWSLAIWESGRREILLASDFAGIRSLYYHRNSTGVYWSSCLADLVHWTGASELDDTYVASFLAGGKQFHRTPYAGIVSVPPGHAVSIGQDGIASRAFWTLPFQQEIRYPDERQYEERLLELFRESVHARLPTDAPACAELSGGLDSSSIVCMADRLRREIAEPPGLITFSYTHDNSPDEKFFCEVERACRVSACHLDLHEYPAASADRMGAVPVLWEPRFQGLSRRMADLGSSVLLTGQFGDFVMGNFHDDFGQVAGCLAAGRLAEAGRTAYAWGRAMQAPIYPILWRGVREAYFSWVPPTSPNDSVGAMPGSREDSLTDGLRTLLVSQQKHWLSEDPVRHAPPGRRRRFRAAAEVFRSRVLQTPEALQHISYTHPYAHRPLVEFMLTIPADVVWGPGQPRRLMRRAFAGLLPPLVLNRKSKASYASTFRRALVPLAAGLLKGSDEIQVVERGYLDRRSFLSRVERFCQGLDCNETQLGQAVLLEFWLRSRCFVGHALACPGQRSSPSFSSR